VAHRSRDVPRREPAVPRSRGGRDGATARASPTLRPRRDDVLPALGGGADATPRDELLDDLYEALALGVADYYRKTGAFKCIGLALSGGRDSLLTLLVAWGALRRIHAGARRATRSRGGDEAVLFAFYMPTRFSSDATRDAAAQVARTWARRSRCCPIEEAFERELDATRDMLGEGGPAMTEITQQNVQARIRGQRMWNWANTSGALFLQTGNMSEKALGYTTVGGDLEGAFSVIANLPKTVVIALIERLHRALRVRGDPADARDDRRPRARREPVGRGELMPFEVLDACLYLYGAEKLATDEVATALPSLFPGRDPAELRAWAQKFARLFTQSIFKWVQSPIAIHLGSLDLDRERALAAPRRAANGVVKPARPGGDSEADPEERDHLTHHAGARTGHREGLGLDRQAEARRGGGDACFQAQGAASAPAVVRLVIGAAGVVPVLTERIGEEVQVGEAHRPVRTQRGIGGEREAGAGGDRADVRVDAIAVVVGDRERLPQEPRLDGEPVGGDREDELDACRQGGLPDLGQEAGARAGVDASPFEAEGAIVGRWSSLGIVRRSARRIDRGLLGGGGAREAGREEDGPDREQEAETRDVEGRAERTVHRTPSPRLIKNRAAPRARCTDRGASPPPPWP
jgi:NAD+ synthetase